MDFSATFHNFVPMKRNLLIMGMLCLFSFVYAQGPNGSKTYYQNADGKKGSALKTALYGIISDHTQLSYTPGVWEGVEKVDIRDDGYILDRYSNITNYTKVKDRAGSYTNEGDCYNREHSFPKDWFDDGKPMYTDLMHIVASDGKVNGNRGNLPYGETNGGKNNSTNNYSKIGSCTTAGYMGSTNVFEPNDEWKGDFARIYFYMVTCYEDKVSDWHSDMLIVPADKYQPFSLWAINMLLRWAKNDPVSDVEKKRNEGVYGVQKNRNPFVDYPGLEQYIWGSKKNESFSYSSYVEPTEYVIEYGSSGGGSGEEQGGGQEQGGETPANATIALNNAFFGCSYNGAINSGDSQDLVGTQNGITVKYSLASGSNRYCNDSQIRLYQNNTFTVSVGQGTITKIEFELVTSSGKTLYASTGTMDGLTWTGNASSVTFHVNSGSGNMQIKNIKVTVSVPSGIKTLFTKSRKGRQTYNLRGQRVKRAGKGIYIKNGKKVIIH